jgi:hypothetical protein
MEVCDLLRWEQSCQEATPSAECGSQKRCLRQSQSPRGRAGVLSRAGATSRPEPTRPLLHPNLMHANSAPLPENAALPPGDCSLGALLPATAALLLQAAQQIRHAAP